MPLHFCWRSWRCGPSTSVRGRHRPGAPDRTRWLEELEVDQVNVWHKAHVDDIDRWAEERAEVYDQILGGAAEAVETKLHPGGRLLWRRPKTAKGYDKHAEAYWAF
ncbi:MAG: hypothetical protein ACFCU2_08725 [Acidimicrobiia bacterium]